MLSGTRPQRLSTGLHVHGISKGAVPLEEYFIAEYFQSGLEVGSGMTVIDVGANIGLFSLEVLRRSQGRARIIACEPAPQSFACLERNIAEQFPDASVSCLCCALGAEPGHATLYYKPRFTQLSSLYEEPLLAESEGIAAALREPPPEFARRARLPESLRRRVAPAFLKIIVRWIGRKVVEVDCEVKTLSAVIRESGVERIDVLKVDVEGAELSVLRGIEPDDWSKIGAVAAEVHDLDGRVDAIRGMLESAGFDRIEFTQGWPFEGTNMYMLEATRSADRGAAAEEASASPVS